MKIRYLQGIVTIIALFPVAALSSSLEVLVTNIKSEKGQIGCALHQSAENFPMGDAMIQLWQPASKGEVRCSFENIDPGTYAVAVSHDLNENGITDTNFLGIPKEDWGVSNNIRPRMRAPTFDEAKFQYPDVTSIEIKID